MSTLATNAITDASGGNTATINGFTPTVSNMAGRNKIINGDMRISQRGTSFTSSGSNQYTLDRFFEYGSVASKFTVAQSSTAPTGFINSLLVTSSAATTVGSSDQYRIEQDIEGLNCADLAWGTSSAATVTLSFWVRSSLTGTFGGSIRNGAADRSYPFTYTISSANTWEQKIVTIAGDQSGTWLTTNGNGMRVCFGLGIGSTLSGTAGTWAAANYASATGATSVVGTNGATFYITGVQLEEGSVATPFEHVDYSEMLRRCQRYFCKTFPQDVAPANGLALPTESTVAMYTATNGQGMYFTYPVTMRAAPTITLYRGLSRGATDGQWAVYNGSSWNSATTIILGGGLSPVGFTPVVSTGGALTSGLAYLLSGHYTSSSEL